MVLCVHLTGHVRDILRRMATDGEKALERFHEWCASEGVDYDREALEIKTFVDASAGLHR